MRKSITLFITLVFIIVSISIIAAILKNYEKITSISFDFIPQNTKIIQNVKSILKDANETKSFFYKPFFISSKEGDFRGRFEIKPICSININDYLQKNKIDKNIDTFMDFLANKYNIQDIYYLKDLILDSIDKDDTERSPYSEIKLQDTKFIDGNIYSFKQFEEILKYYIKQRNDKNVLKVPWRKFFNFKTTQLFKECINKNILTLNEENVTKFNIITYDKNVSSFIVTINVDYFLKNEHNLSIFYDLKKKKVIEIEENPVY